MKSTRSLGEAYRVSCSLTVRHGYLLDDGTYPHGYSTTVTMDSTVLGLIHTEPNLHDWDEFCGRPLTFYPPQGYAGRGFEWDDIAAILPSGTVVGVEWLRKTADADHLRIVTACTAAVEGSWHPATVGPNFSMSQNQDQVSGQACDDIGCYAIVNGSFLDPDLTIEYDVNGMTHRVVAELSDDGATLDGELSVDGVFIDAYSWKRQ